MIPLFNGERFDVETIRSVLGQTYGSFEVIVIDDGSTEGAARAATVADARVRAVSRPNRGVAAARNAGAALASPRSRYLVFLDADDRWHPETLATLVDAVERRPGAADAFVLAETWMTEARRCRRATSPRTCAFVRS